MPGGCVSTGHSHRHCGSGAWAPVHSRLIGTSWVKRHLQFTAPGPALPSPDRRTEPHRSGNAGLTPHSHLAAGQDGRGWLRRRCM